MRDGQATTELERKRQRGHAGIVLVPTHVYDDVDALPISLGSWTIGSSPESDLRLNVEGVAPHHCTVIVGKHRTIVKSWSPLTWINDGAVREALLRVGDRLIVGPVEFTVRQAAIEDESPLPQQAAHYSPPTIDLLLEQARTTGRDAPSTRTGDIAAGSVGSSGNRVAPSFEQRQTLSQYESALNERTWILDRREALILESVRDLQQLVEEHHRSTQQLLSDRTALKHAQSEFLQRQHDIDLLRDDVLAQRSELAEQWASWEATRHQIERERIDLETRRAEADEASAVAFQKLSETERREAALRVWEAKLTEWASQLDERDLESEQVAESLREERQSLHDRAADLAAQQVFVKDERSALIARQEQLAEREHALDVRESAIQRGEQSLVTREEELQRSVNDLEMRLEQLAEREQDLHSRSSDLDQRESRLREQVAALETHRAAQEKQAQAIKQRAEDVEVRAAAVATEFEELAAQKADLAQQAAALESERQVLTREREEIEGSHRALDGRTDELDQRDVELTALAQELESKRIELSAASGQLDVERQDVEREREEVGRQREELEHQRESLQQREDELDQASDRIELARAEVEALRTEVMAEQESLAGERDRLADEARRWTEEASRLETNAAELDALRAEVTLQQEQSAEEAERQASASRQLQEQAARLEEARAELATERERLAEETARQENEARRLQEEWTRLESARSELEERLAAHDAGSSTDASAAQSLLEAERADIAERQQAQERQSEELRRLQDELECQRREFDERVARFEQKEREVLEALGAQRAAWEAERTALNDADAVADPSTTETERHLAAERERLELREEKLRQWAEQLEESEESIKGERLRIQNEAGQLQEVRDSLEQMREDAERERSALGAEAEDLQSQQLELEAHRQSLDDLSAVLEGRSRQLDEEEVALETQRQDLEAWQARLQSQEAEGHPVDGEVHHGTSVEDLQTRAAELDEREGELATFREDLVREHESLAARAAELEAWAESLREAAERDDASRFGDRSADESFESGDQEIRDQHDHIDGVTETGHSSGQYSSVIDEELSATSDPVASESEAFSSTWDTMDRHDDSDGSEDLHEGSYDDGGETDSEAEHLRSELHRLFGLDDTAFSGSSVSPEEEVTHSSETMGDDAAVESLEAEAPSVDASPEIDGRVTDEDDEPETSVDASRDASDEDDWVNEEDPVAAYMQRLLARSRGEDSAHQSPAEPVVSKQPATASRESSSAVAVAETSAVDADADESEAEVNEDSAQRRKKDPVDKEALRANLDSFRELANMSARKAVAKSALSRLRAQRKRFIIWTGLGATTTCGFLGAYAITEGGNMLVAASLAAAATSLTGLKIVLTTRERRDLLRHAGASGQEQGGEEALLEPGETPEAATESD